MRAELHLGEDEYPLPLLESPRPPKTLCVAGDVSLLGYGLAIVGARRATPYGLACARLFAGWAAQHGVTIVSGAARGCDQAAQRAAVEAGGRSVAVLGCGADVDYPASASDLLAHLRVHGAVVSELPWGTQPLRRAFPARNRLIAAFARAVLVVEAGLPSGTFSTAEHALDASREVWVVPGSIFAPECRGPNRLLAQGATPITDVSELSAALHAAGLLEDASATVPSLLVDAADPLAHAIVANPMRPDDLAHTLGLDIVDIMRRIAALEAEGFCKRLPDGRYAAIKREAPAERRV